MEICRVPDDLDVLHILFLPRALARELLHDMEKALAING